MHKQAKAWLAAIQKIIPDLYVALMINVKALFGVIHSKKPHSSQLPIARLLMFS
jgi:hypothetical protein